jgi:hypothetical protein
MWRAPLPGSFRFDDLPAHLYHAELARHSCSMLKQMLVSPGHYVRQFFTHRASSPAMAFGSLVHLLVLEPHRLPERYAVIPGTGRPSPGERREAQILHPGREILSEVELHEARIAAERVLLRQVRGRPFQEFVREGLPEVTFFFQDPVTNLACRARIDLWHPEAVFDLKTTRHAEVATPAAPRAGRYRRPLRISEDGADRAMDSITSIVCNVLGDCPICSAQRGWANVESWALRSCVAARSVGTWRASDCPCCASEHSDASKTMFDFAPKFCRIGTTMFDRSLPWKWCSRRWATAQRWSCRRPC